MSGLHEALAKIQADLPDVPKTKTAKIPTKNGGEFSYDYADLSDVTSALLPRLSAEGLTWVCTPEPSDKGYVLIGRLTHAESDTSESGAWPLPNTDDPQRLGSAVTYARRYLLCAMVGLVPDDDDDGRRAQAPRLTAQQRVSGALDASPIPEARYFDVAELYGAESVEQLSDEAADKLHRNLASDKALGAILEKLGLDENGDEVPF